MMYVIDIIKTSRHAFSSMVGSGSRSQGLLGDGILICRPPVYDLIYAFP